MKKLPVTVQPLNKVIEARQGVSLLSALLQARVPVMNRCGGNGSCGTCKVQVQELLQASKSTLTRNEQRLLSQEQIEAGFRLSCQYKVAAAVTVTLPETPLQRTIRKMLEDNKRNQ